jgi:hypothetical protein
MPTIAAIQRTNVVLIAMTAGVLTFVSSTNAAVSCVLGGAVVVANLFALSILGRLFLGVAAGGGKIAAKVGFLAIPLKLMLAIALIYVIFSRTPIDGLGFAFGVLTQMTAIIIETTRARISGGSPMNSGGEAPCQSQ